MTSPSIDQQPQVAALHHALDALAHAPHRAPQCQLVGPDGEFLALPDAVFDVLDRAVAVMACGESVTLVPVATVLTTQQAADVLSVSRQYVVRLIDEGRLPAQRTGTHRRLQLRDVLTFKAQRDAERRGQLRELTRLTEAFGGYDTET